MIGIKIDSFKAVMGSEDFRDKLNKNRALVSNLHTLKELREDFAWFLCAYPLSPAKEKVILKMDGKKKFGLLSRHLMSVSKNLGIGDLFLENFHELKEDEAIAMRSVKKESWKYYYNNILRDNETVSEQLDIAKREGEDRKEFRLLSRMLFRQTVQMLEFCVKHYDAREDKINQILEENE
jgi:hypothetical protein